MATATQQPDGRARLKSFYLRGAKRIEKKHHSFGPANRFTAGVTLARERAALADSFITKAAALPPSAPRGVAFVALGGYGRGDLCPFSDIDLLVLHEPGLEEEAAVAAEGVFHPLWDMKIDLGHAVRTVEDCALLCKEDFVTFTSLLDCRFVAGDPRPYEALEAAIANDLMPELSKRFITEKIAEAEKRREKFGSSVWMLEPNVKESEGAQRDLNTMLWIAQAKYKVKSFEDLLAKGVLSEKEFRVTMKCMSFLLLVRSHLHYLAGRKQDRLAFDCQSDVARFFGYQDSSMKAVEKFMRVYYLRAGLVSEQFQRTLERVAASYTPARNTGARHLGGGFTVSDGVLSVTGKNVFTKTPENLVRAFEYSDRHGVEMSRYLRGLIRERVPLMDEEMRNSPEFSRIFTGILKTGGNVYKTLSLMNRLRFLAHYIPEFGRIVCMMRHNAYHLYTVDIHSLFLVDEVEKLFNYSREREFPLLTKVAESVMCREVLYLACLFHDIGKSVAGKGHERAGRDMVRKIARRLGLPPRDRNLLEFLVENHQVMSDFSQKQDINDTELVSNLARRIGDEERLSLLYILTFADLRSVGGDVWNNWKGMLLKNLYFSLLRVFESGRVERSPSAGARKKTVCAEIERLSGGKVSAGAAAEAIGKMPPSYLFNHSPASMAKHLEIMGAHRGGVSTGVVHHRAEGYDEFVFWGKDRKRLFRTLCGVMSANGFNILDARAENSNRGNVLDVMYVSRPGGSAAGSPELWGKVEADIKKALAGALDLDGEMKKRRRFALARRKTASSAPAVVFDNESSDRATIVEVVADDREGVLYDITSALAEAGVSITYAKVSTRAEQVFDVFYVTGRGGRKVESRGALEKIRRCLLARLGGEG